MTLGFPRVRSAISDGFHHIAMQEAGEVDVIAGTATAGIPHAAWLADRLHLPMAYVRGSAKSHGQRNRIEGIVSSGDRVLLVEDLISTGGSALSAVSALENAGAVVVSVCAIFTYELETSEKAFADAGVSLHALTDFSTLLDVARREHDLRDAEVASLEEWRQDPEAWSAAHGGT
jgi:orotate phosphoribosyltransferase